MLISNTEKVHQLIPCGNELREKAGEKTAAILSAETRANPKPELEINT